jgi:hypothetical protein
MAVVRRSCSSFIGSKLDSCSTYFQTGLALSFSRRVCAMQLCISRFVAFGTSSLIEQCLTKINLASRRVDYLPMMAQQMSLQNGMAPTRSNAFHRERLSHGRFRVIGPNGRRLWRGVVRCHSWPLTSASAMRYRVTTRYLGMPICWDVPLLVPKVRQFPFNFGH